MASAPPFKQPPRQMILSDRHYRDNEGLTVMVPAEIGNDLGTDYDWQLDTTEQEFLNGQKVRLNQGRVVGGGTVLNGLVWTRSSIKDYDLWEDLNYNASQPTEYSWRWPDMLPYFEKVSLRPDSCRGQGNVILIVTTD